MAKKFPYYPHFVDDFSGDKNVLAMSLAEVGLYQLMLDQAWSLESLPDDPEAVAVLIRRKASDVKKAWPKVRECWVPNCQAGMIVNPRQEEERLKAIEKSEQGKKAVSLRRDRKKSVATESLPKSYVSTKSVGSSVSTESLPRAYDSEYDSSEDLKKVNDAELEPSYWSKKLYDQHPKARNRTLVEAWVCRYFVDFEDPKEFALNMREIYRVHALWCATDSWQKEGGQFAPKLDEWLDDHGWKREPKQANGSKSKLDLLMESI